MNFERCQKIVAVVEGGANFDVVNGKPVLKPKNRNDTGGPTNYGITWGTLAKAYSQGIVNHNDITKLSKDEADAIYEVNYWRPSRADKMQSGVESNAEAIEGIKKDVAVLSEKVDAYMKKAHTNRVIIIAILIVSILLGFLPKDQMTTFMQFLARNTRMHLIDEYK